MDKWKAANEPGEAPLPIILAADRIREIAAHEVGHFALGCRANIYPKWIRVGHRGDELGSCGVGQPLPPWTLRKYAAFRGMSQRVLRDHQRDLAAVNLGGYVAEALYLDRDAFDYVDEIECGDYDDDPDPDLRYGYARCAWAAGVADPVDSVAPPESLPACSEYSRAVRREVRVSIDIAVRYLTDHWATVTRMARTLVRQTPDEQECRSLSSLSIYRWTRRFAPATRR